MLIYHAAQKHSAVLCTQLWSVFCFFADHKDKLFLLLALVLQQCYFSTAVYVDCLSVCLSVSCSSLTACLEAGISAVKPLFTNLCISFVSFGANANMEF